MIPPNKQLTRPSHFPYTTLFRSRGSAPDPLPWPRRDDGGHRRRLGHLEVDRLPVLHRQGAPATHAGPKHTVDHAPQAPARAEGAGIEQDRKSTRLNSSHVAISCAAFCLKKKRSHL